MAEKIILKNVKKSFGTKEVLKGVDLSIHNGESLVILGGSGSGKSVLLKCILGLLHADSGQILIDGENMLNASSKKRDQFLRKFGMLFQGGALFDSLPIWRNVTFGLIQNEKYSKAQALKRAEELLESVGLGKEVLNLRPSELSGGMQKRAGLARAISMNPEIIFFDEPTTGLDPIMCGVIDELIINSVKRLGATGITITHDLTSAHNIADTVAMLYQGKIYWNGPVEDLETCDIPVVKEFITGHTVETKARFQ